jgi:hypothetical protein
MEPRCPQCLSPEIDPPLDARPEWRCRVCGRLFGLEDALVTFAEAEGFGRPSKVEPAFTVDRDAAERELRDPDSPLNALSPYADAEELRQALRAALAGGVIAGPRPGSGLSVHFLAGELPGAEPRMVLGIDPGFGIELLGPLLDLRPDPAEDPVAYTIRQLGRIVADASSAAARLQVPLPAAAGSASPGGPVSGRRWRAVCSTLFADGTVGPTIAEVDALSLSGVLTEIGERVEEADLDPEPDALGLTVTWEDRR